MISIVTKFRIRKKGLTIIQMFCASRSSIISIAPITGSSMKNRDWKVSPPPTSGASNTNPSTSTTASPQQTSSTTSKTVSSAPMRIGLGIVIMCR
ncbi:MAG: hypothetical protein K1X49_10575 [Saprospiraceae bacterium]|nr:hypothetical protein [Saprospiraceae bacterium]